MDEPVRLTMPDGTVIWARVDGAAAGTDQAPETLSQTPETPGRGPQSAPGQPGITAPPGPGGRGAQERGPSDIGFPLHRKHDAADQPSMLTNFVETVKSVAASVHDAVVSQAPSGVSVEFGLELSVQTGQFVAVLAQAGAKTSVTVRLEWDREALAAAAKPPQGPHAVDPNAAAAKPSQDPSAADPNAAGPNAVGLSAADPKPSQGPNAVDLNTVDPNAAESE